MINMESADYDKGLAQALADHLEGTCFNLASLQADSLFTVVRTHLAT